MFQMDDLKRDSLIDKIFRYVKLNVHIKTDGFRVYTDLKEFVAKHTTKITPKEKGQIELP